MVKVSEISVLGRITSGVKLIDLDPDKEIVVASIAKVRDAIPENTEATGEKITELTENKTEVDIIETTEDINEDNSLEKLIERANQDKEE